MAAPISPQGSRAGLITAVVIFVILFVTSTIFAVYFQTLYQKEQQSTEQERQKAAQVLNPAAMSNEEVRTYIDQAQKQKPDAAWDVLSRERAQLAIAIAGGALPTAKATNSARDALKYASDKVKSGATVGTELVSTVRSLADGIVVTQDELKKAQDATAAAAAATKQVTDAQNALLSAKDADIAKAAAATAALQTQVEDYQKQKSGDVEQVTAAALQKNKDYQAAAEKDQAEKQKLTAKTLETTKENEALRRRLSAMRINPKEAIIQQADGHILRIPARDTLFIDIGQQQHVTPGLTFEVYDKEQGVPALGDVAREGDLPIGKASIEVLHVMANTSECRVVRHTLGANLTEGDIIVNLVFDPKATYNFVVYGDFNLAQGANTNPADIEVMKRLITQWGGRVQAGVNVDTDFLVMGREPVVPTLTKEDETDTLKQKKHDDMAAALEAYLDVRDKAIKLGVPILNQNRFLYFIGYYDTAQR